MACATCVRVVLAQWWFFHTLHRAVHLLNTALALALDPVQVPEHVRKGYEKAQSAVAVRRASEEAVAPGKAADSTLLAAYIAYTKLEEAQGDPARVQARSGPASVEGQPWWLHGGMCICLKR